MEQRRIGSVKLDTPFLLGPMAGITDAPFRRICREQGASLCCTEMISSKGLYYGDKKTEKMLFMYDDELPTAVQLFGHDPDTMKAACEKIEELPNAIVDINMGCPVPKVFKNGDGSALLRDPDLAEKVVAACAGATDKPVTVKIRLGIDSSTINAAEMAKAIEAGGASAVCVHARTREQFYSGEADWEKIKEVKEQVSIPVIGNGDVRSGEDALRMMRETGCDFVMVARAALGDPWIFREMKEAWEKAGASLEAGSEESAKEGTGIPGAGRYVPAREERVDMMLRTLREMTELKGEYAAVREMRKVFGWYVKGLPGSAKLRVKVNGIEDASELEDAIRAVARPD